MLKLNLEVLHRQDSTSSGVYRGLPLPADSKEGKRKSHNQIMG
jgi:hypothetical protein